MSAQFPRLIASVGIVFAASAFVGCASAADAVPEKTAPPVEAAYPLTIDNCGTEVTFDAAPDRVLAIKSTSIEMMLALGLEDQMIGTAFSDGPLADEWAHRADDIPVIDDRVPGQEATLDLEPDLIYAGWESNVTADGAGDRDVLASLGVNTYVSPSACQEPGYQPNPLTFEGLFGDITEMGAIFDIPDRAASVVTDLEDRLNALVPDDRGLTALWYSSGEETPFVGGGIGAPQMMMDAAGLTNLVADVEATWTSLSWEAIVDANPDVIVLIGSEWNPVEKKIAALEANPATAALPAVQNQQYLTLPFPTAEAGVRNVEAVESLVTQLKDLDLP